jgi:hypothetical protein
MTPPKTLLKRVYTVSPTTGTTGDAHDGFELAACHAISWQLRAGLYGIGASCTVSYSEAAGVVLPEDGASESNALRDFGGKRLGWGLSIAIARCACLHCVSYAGAREEDVHSSTAAGTLNCPVHSQTLC